MPKPNILFITADQWRGDCLSGLGHPDVKTPQLDRLMADGMAFTQHYSACTPCGPSRASLLTGLYLQNHRSVRNGTPLDQRHSNIALELRKAGYQPALFGYTDTTLDPRYLPEEAVCANGYESMLPGFETGLLLPAATPNKWLAWLRQQGHHFSSAEQANQNVASPATAPRVAYPAEHSQAAFLTAGVIKHLQQSRPGWCVHLSYLRPHPPFCAPVPYSAMYSPAELAPLTPPFIPEQENPWLSAARSPLGDWPEGWMADLATSSDFEQATQQIRASYYGLISKVDHYIGQLIDYLQATGQYDNTLILFTSDHGELLGDHGLFGKRGYFKESNHVPLIIRTPSQASTGTQCKEFTESVDIMPTLLDCLDLPIPRQCDGHSLRPLLRGSAPSNWRTAAHWEYDFRDPAEPALAAQLGISAEQCQMNVIYDAQFLYVHFTALPALLFDLQQDPQAAQNVIDQPEYAATALAYAQRLLSWRMGNDERTLTGYSVSREGIHHS